MELDMHVFPVLRCIKQADLRSSPEPIVRATASASVRGLLKQSF